MNLGKIAVKKEWTVRLRDMPDGPDSDASFTLRLLSPRERQLAFEAGTETTMVPDGDGALNPVIRVHVRGAQEFVFKKAVIAWSGILGADGSELPCTDLHKRTFMDVAPDVVDWLVSLHGQQADKEIAARNEELKNSSATSGD